MNGVYCLTFPNGKRYVGKSVTKKIGIEKRWNIYKKLKCLDQPYLLNALKFYGVDNVKFEVVLETNDDTRAKSLEKQLIAFWKLNVSRFGVDARGYNLTDGGDGSYGKSPSKETRMKMRLAKLGKKKDPDVVRRSAETFKKRIASGEVKPSGLGHKHSIETKLKLSRHMKEYLKINKRSAMSQEIKDKISNTKKGLVPWNKGKSKYSQ